MKNYTIVLAVLFLISSHFMLLNITPALALESDKITVEAEGSGTTKLEALKDAWAVAVRKAVGMYMNARSDLKSDGLDDNYTEQIASYSRGQVDSFTVLSENQENGIWTIKIKANVDNDVLKETVAEASSKKVHIDGANLAAQIQTSENKKQDAIEVIKNSGLLDFSKCFDYSAKLIKKEHDSTPVMLMRYILKMNPAKFKAQANELEKLIKNITSGKRQTPLNQNWVKKLLAIEKMNDYPLTFDFSAYARAKAMNNGIAYYIPYSAQFITNQSSANTFSSFPDNTASQKIQALLGGTRGNLQIKGSDSDKSEICFFKNSSHADCYAIPKAVFAELEKQALFTLRFKIENEDELDNNVGESPTFPISFLGSGDALFVTPFIQIGAEDMEPLVSHNDFYQCPVFIYDMFLDFSVPDLVGMKDLTTSYQVTPYTGNE